MSAFVALRVLLARGAVRLAAGQRSQGLFTYAHWFVRVLAYECLFSSLGCSVELLICWHGFVCMLECSHPRLGLFEGVLRGWFAYLRVSCHSKCLYVFTHAHCCSERMSVCICVE